MDAKVYKRDENGTVTHISIREGLAEINYAMMAGKRDVREMSSITSTDYAIEYKGGRKVTLTRVDAPVEQGPKVWTGEAARIVTANGKRYVVGTVRPAGANTPRAYVHYWAERNGEAFGATRSTNGDAKPGTVGRAIWDAAAK